MGNDSLSRMKRSLEVYELGQFDYGFPEDLVAQQPVSDRSSSRLLVSTAGGDFFHSSTSHFSEFLPPRSLLLFNETRVIPARIPVSLAQSAKGEVLLLEKLDDEGRRWSAIGRPQSKLLKLGRCRTLGSGAELLVSPALRDSGFTVDIPLGSDEDLDSFLLANGEVPLPPYIKRLSGPDSQADSIRQQDKNSYQTVYAKEGYSAAAPTAGLHFTPAILRQLKDEGHQLEFVNLQVGAGTFLPVVSADIRDHRMHEEQYCVSQRTYLAIEAAYKEARPIVCVGTTTFRCVESFYQDTATLSADKRFEEASKTHRTSLFIFPRAGEDLYTPFRMSGMVTNFHQPKSTLLMLVMALFGRKRISTLYKTAIENRYRLFSYGDASLIWRQ